MDDGNNSKRVDDIGFSYLFIFMCFVLLYFEVGELVRECVFIRLFGKKIGE